MLLKSIGSDWLCKLLSRKICKAFFSIVHLLRLYFRQAAMECCPFFFRFVRHFWSPGGSCYQNSVKACPTIQSLVWSGPKDFDRLKFPTFLPPFQTRRNGRKKSEMDIFMKMPRHLVIELDSAQF